MQDYSYWVFGYRDVLQQFTWRQLQVRHRGSALGWLWSVVTPCLMLMVYTIIFYQVFHVRWDRLAPESVLQFAMQLFAGMLVFSVVTEVVSRSPNLIYEQANLVKKMRFPLPILSWATVLSSLLYVFPPLMLLLVATTWQGQLQWSALALPMILLPLVPLLLGVSWVLAALGVYLRDIQQVLGLFLSVLQFLSPIFYPVSALPKILVPWLAFNPLTPIIEQTRLALFYGIWPNLNDCLSELLVGLIIASVGAFIFERLRPGFADVL
jgi:lipopolysaccharide transport system permease protein